MAHVEVLEESCRRWSELEQRNATSLNVCPVRCNDVAWSTPAPHHRRRPSLAPPSFPRRRANTAALSERIKRARINSLLSLPLAFSGTDFSFSTHSLRVHSTHRRPPPSFLPPPGCRVSLSLLPHGAAHADPRREGGSEGGREGGREEGGEEPNAHLLPKIVYDRGRLL